jgi:peptidoglycan/LPS O-acetylase OafA/YrhL
MHLVLDQSSASKSNRNSDHLPALDGWRGISIAFVLAGHMLPLGPKIWQLNATIAATGMSLFFILSGFLITSMLARNSNVLSFLIRRIFRIVPLAWTYLLIVLTLNHADISGVLANLLFYANLPPFYLDYENGQFWSLGVEMQFYAGVALVVACCGRAGLSLVPVFCVCITAARIYFGVESSIVTWFRIDEILAGGTLALAMILLLRRKIIFHIHWAIPAVLLALLIASCHPEAGYLGYLRPYLAASLVGASLLSSAGFTQKILGSALLGYLARISYALYVVHVITYSGWMGQGDVAVRYGKRIASFLITFALAHFSTFYFERFWNSVGHRLARKVEGNASMTGKTDTADAVL